VTRARALLVGLTVAGVAAGAAPPAVSLELGIQDDRLLLGAPITADGTSIAPSAGLRAAKRLGARSVKLLVHWAAVAPTAESTPNLTRYDGAVDLARATGLRVQLTLDGPAPAWATTDNRVGNQRPNANAFARFATAVATHFKGRVARYAIWNEPNWHGHLTPTRDAPRLYRALYRAGWASIRRAEPEAQVLFGELAPLGRPEAATPPLRFLRAATCSNRRWHAARRCRPLRTSGFAHHPYTLRWNPTFPGASPDDVTTGSLGRLVSALRRLARRGALSTPAGRTPPLYLTEWGWHAHSLRIPEPIRSCFIADGLALIAHQPSVREVIWYQLVGTGEPPPHWDTGLLDPDGQPRPAYTALRRAYDSITNPRRIHAREQTRPASCIAP
jgi:Cellulase (glycosyl hydrolase family 5)